MTFPPGSFFSAAHVEWHDQLDSTNNRAAELARIADLPLPALIVADQQTAGRGRGGNRWWSSEGSLTFSVLIDASDNVLPPARWPLVSLATALGVADVLDELLPGNTVRLKWPNDVYVAGADGTARKICGILVETPPVRPARLIVGIGLNVNNAVAAAPDDVPARATSCLDELGAPLDREAVLERLMPALARRWQAVPRPDFDLCSLWQPRCLLTGKEVVIAAGDRRIVGRCQGVFHDGALVVQTATGVERLFAGVVERWG